MALKIRLLNEMFGTLLILKDDPIGINDVPQIVKRSPEHDGIIYEIIFDLEFIKGSRKFLQNCYLFDGGIDAIVNVEIYDWDPNTYLWELYAIGQVNFSDKDIGETDIKVTIEQTGIERRVLNMLERDVDVETVVSEDGSALPAQSIEIVPYHSQKLEAKFEGQSEDDSATIFTADFAPDIVLEYFVTFGIEPSVNNPVDEIEQRFSQAIAVFPGTTFAEVRPNPIYGNKLYRYKIKDAGDYTFDFDKLCFRLTTLYNPGHAGPENHTLKLILAYGREGSFTEIEMASVTQLDNIAINIQQAFNSGVLSLERNDEVYIYAKHIAPGYTGTPVHYSYNAIHLTSFPPSSQSTKLKITAETTFPETNVRNVLIYEAVQRCVQFITNEIDCFHSDLLGRVDLGYDADGDASLIGIVNGQRLRANDDRQLFSTLKDLLEFINASFCIGYGFEVINGIRKFRVERKEYFYNKSVKSVSLGKVYLVRNKVDASRYYNQIEYGYNTKIDIEKVDGINEFNTIRRSSIPIVNTDNKLNVSTKMITSGATIETQRRLGGSTVDSKYDDDKFAVKLIRDGGGFRSKKDEGYDLITGIKFPETTYNLDLSPAECLKSWYKVIAACLIRSKSKVIKFTYGEKNFVLAKRRAGETEITSENGEKDLSGIEPYFDPEIYPLENVKLTREQMKLIKADPYAYLEFEDQFGEFGYGYLNTDVGVEHNSNKRQASFNLLKVHKPII